MIVKCSIEMVKNLFYRCCSLVSNNGTLHLTNGIQRPLILNGNLHCALLALLECRSQLKSALSIANCFLKMRV